MSEQTQSLSKKAKTFIHLNYGITELRWKSQCNSNSQTPQLVSDCGGGVSPQEPRQLQTQ